MSIPSHAKQAGGSPPRRAAAPCRQITIGGGADDAERRSPKAARSSYTTMTVPSRNGSCYTWETRAFAEESSSQLDAGVWPPRAYPCTFCEREFRSAQALGGHMNVHRRDRARLRHASPSPPSPAFGSIVAAPHSQSLLHIQNFSAVLSAQYSSESLAKLHSPANALSKSSNLPAAIPCPSLPLRYPSTAAASLPPCLQQLASEAAASLSEYPPQQHRCNSSDLLSLVPPLNGNRGSFGCHSSKRGAVIKEKSPQIVSTSSSLSPPPSSNATSCAPVPSIRDGANRRWNSPLIEPDEERSLKENDRNELFSHIITDSDALKEVLNSLDVRPILTETASNMTCMLRRNGAYETACGNRSEGDVDLELRLGRPPP